MSNMRDLADVVDDGSTWIINNVTTQNATLVDPGKIYLPIAAFCKEEVRRYLDEGYTVRIPKGITNEILFGNLIIEKDDDPVVVYRNVLIARNRNEFANNIVSMNVFDFYGFMACNAKLVQKGYLLTDENRQSQYIEILNGDDDEARDILRDYIDASENVDQSYQVYKTMLTKIRKLENANSIEELDTIQAE